jgi:very-short-patch-repair endonuclease
MTETIAQIAERYRSKALRLTPDLGDQSCGFHIAFARCESPIEQMFCLSLFQVTPGIWAIDGDFRPSLLEHRPKARGVLVFAQQPIKQYRADFLLVALSPEQVEAAFLIVECDGQEFHSSADAIKRDARRERVLRNTGFRIVRHTGADIYANPCEVVAKTFEHLDSHGWTRSDSWAVDNLTIWRAMMALQGGDPNMGYRPPTLKPASQSITAILDKIGAPVSLTPVSRPCSGLQKHGDNGSEL